jgi:hypothetical protein
MFGQKLRRYLSGGSLPYLRTPHQTLLPILRSAQRGARRMRRRAPDVIIPKVLVRLSSHPELVAFVLAANAATLSGSYSHPAPVFTARIFLSFASWMMY